MDFDDRINPLRQLHRIKLSSLDRDGATPDVLKSIRFGRIYESCLEILRAQAASGLPHLDDGCIADMGAETLFDDNMTFIAAVALSRPAPDYDELMSYALMVKEHRDIEDALPKIIRKFGRQNSFYQFLMAQQTHDDVLVRMFDLNASKASQLVAPRGDKSAMSRLAKVFRQDTKTLTDKALAHFPIERAKVFRERLTGKGEMSNFEFTERMDIFCRQKGGLTKGLFEDETEESFSLAEIMGMPGFDEKVTINADEVVKSFYRSLRGQGSEAEMGELEAIEQRVVAPLIKRTENRAKAFFEQALSKGTSWVKDVLDTPDGGRQIYLHMLIDGASSNKVVDNLLVKAFVRFEPAQDLLAECKDDNALSKLYGMTGNTDFLRSASHKVRDRAIAQDLGL
ncbi:hypothetical protein [Pseudomonas sp. CFBP 13719]|uniref:hypothetical protein n=1 Tax=Pseudomonas sp. CFBP 13719 TaxID=2775303 RepID=UPI0017842999|nr:hypothetical protein [Pseudomonas sp. CFBP 13719]MBD8681747.1 hypothetical protein [Pseudomonas sp. CFBP 13719]